MEVLNLPNDISVFGSRVLTFPKGISEAFDELVKTIGGFHRSFYGISYMTAEGDMAYFATAEEIYDGEGEKYHRERLVIEKGDYLSITIKDWRTRTDTIQHIFSELIKDERADRTKPAIEWYRNEKEMLCMVKTKHNR